ncbi:T cell receptor alpha chain MC.7.G5-like [Anolis sagrei]|uniref:T cell receptor alpha chain MC.7.G5-like n=1 Tax=Anolis sagrei TaxID=38937 RepID=UPI00351F9A62
MGEEMLQWALETGILCSSEKITQEPLVVGSDGKEVKVSCNHPSAESSTDTIFWYRQFPNQGPEFVVSGYREKATSNRLKSISLLISGDRKSSSLSFAGATLEDTAVYYCALGDTVLRLDVFAEGLKDNLYPNQNVLFPSKKASLFCCRVSMKLHTCLQLSTEGRVGGSVDQMDGIVTVTQGGHISIHCHYEMSSDYRASPFWYIQPLGERPRLLLSDIGNGNFSEQSHQGFEAKHDRKNKTYNLEKRAIQLNDSAVYFCAVMGNNEKLTFGRGTSLRVYPGRKHCGSTSSFNKLIFGSGTKLVVTPRTMNHCGYTNADKLIWGKGTLLKVNPNLEHSDPSVYKLKPSSDEKQGKAACLYTDYSPNPLDVIYKEGTKKVNGSVVVVKEDQSAKGTASYGIVLWGNDDDSFHCPEPKGDSGTCLEEGGDITFETDERLNLLSLTVLGLRVIFLKTVAFNLLFTFRLWSR